MKLLATPILILLLLTQVFGKWLLIADYTINKEYISKNLCINREKPKLNCAGKCQLAKKWQRKKIQIAAKAVNLSKPASLKYCSSMSGTALH